MELIADHVSIAGLHGPLLLPTSLTAGPGHVTLVAGDPGYGHVALALALGGRAPLMDGVVTVDGDASEALRRRHVALVDVPDVTAPEGALSVRAAVAEQLALAGRPASRAATRAFLAGHGVEDQGERFESLPPSTRTTLLMRVAAARAATRVLVVAAPDRLGGDPTDWYAAAERLAAEGLTVVVQVTHGTARQLALPATYELGVAA
ncbi:hypothetical protein [Pedococcus soli]